MSRAAQVVGFAVGPLGSAVAYDRTGTYQGAFLTLALVSVAAALLLVTTRRPTLLNRVLTNLVAIATAVRQRVSDPSRLPRRCAPRNDRFRAGTREVQGLVASGSQRSQLGKLKQGSNPLCVRRIRYGPNYRLSGFERSHWYAIAGIRCDCPVRRALCRRRSECLPD